MASSSRSMRSTPRTSGIPSQETETLAGQPRKVNWPLWIGSLLVIFVLALALFGPGLAPRDPMELNYIIHNPASGKFVKPPFSPFTVPGFPLGTDQQGRDVFSQLLWAVRPTMTMVLMVAALRLGLGILIGLAAGWWMGRRARFLNVAITGAMAIPVFFVALSMLAAIGIKWGVWAFILGLSLTGWAEAARIVREQTRAVRSQLFIEAARSLGASGSQILSRHVLPQVMPLVWMLLSFEVSHTLMTSAGLGFLGYYINAIWVPHGDWSALRTSGRPELGQMLASASGEALSQPWGLLAAGTAVLIIVLAFHLLGEGLRRELAPERRVRKSRLEAALGQASMWLEDRWLSPLSPLRRNAPVLLSAGTLLLAILGGALFLYRSQASASRQSVVQVPGGNLWAAPGRDSQGTLWAEVAGPSQPEILWNIEYEGRFSGGPAIDAGGTLYLTSPDPSLLAYRPEGELKWKAALPAEPFGGPVLNSNGEIFVLDALGTLSAFTPDGAPLWSIQPAAGALPLATPVVSGQGDLFFPTETHIVAVTAAGQLKWAQENPTYSVFEPEVRLSADEKLLFYEDMVLDAASGALLFDRTLDPLDKYIIGTDGKIYLRSQDEMKILRPTEEGAEMSTYARWDGMTLGLVNRIPDEAGVTPDGRIWVSYASDFDYGMLVWIGSDGQTLSSIQLPWAGRTLRVVGLDAAANVYICGVEYEDQHFGSMNLGDVSCRAYRPGRNEPAWEVKLEVADFLVGGAVVPGRIYLTTAVGKLFAIGDPAGEKLARSNPNN